MRKFVQFASGTTFVLYVVLALTAASCLKSKKPGLPADVVSVISATGFNKIELTKTIAKYFESGDSLKLKAAYFLISNMSRKYAMELETTDTAGNLIQINPLNYENGTDFLSHWDSINSQVGGIVYKAKKFTLDTDTITSDLLINTIESAILSQSLPWAKNYDFETFLHYTLPYRIGNESIEDWRTFLTHQFSWINDSAGNTQSPEKIAYMVNNYVNQNFSFNLRHIKNPHLQTLTELFQHKTGNYQDLSYLKTMILRSFGIPSTVDYIPFIADSTYSFYFAVFMDSKGQFQPLIDQQTQSFLRSTNRIPKVYRRIFHNIDSSLFALKKISLTTPPFLGHYHYLDVTSHYAPTKTIQFETICPDSLVYLSVFNDKKWRPVDWSKCSNNKSVFQNVASNIAFKLTYLKIVDNKKDPTNTIIYTE